MLRVLHTSYFEDVTITEEVLGDLMLWIEEIQYECCY